MGEPFQIRPATKDDARVLFEWRNDESTRTMSKSKDPVRWDDHVKWLHHRLQLAAPNLYIFEINGEPVATFRIDDRDISYTVAPEQRSRGIAKLMLQEVRSRFGRLRAEIYPHNLPSIRAAREADMEVIIVEP